VQRHLKIILYTWMFPAGRCEPNEAAVILRELADWIEKRAEPFDLTHHPKNLRNFEGQLCGSMQIYDA
jgi:hypothetical protein